MALSRRARARRRLVAGGGFAGAYVARLLGRAGATIVSPENFMLYTPMLPEAASGTLEPRHVVVPLRQMCPHAELLLGRVTALDEERRRRRASRPTRPATYDVEYEQFVVALGAVARTLPVPGLAEHALGFKDLADAIHLRNHVLRELEAADAALDPAERGRAPLVRLRRRRLRGRRGARGALRPRPGRAALLPAPARRAAALGARRRGAEDPRRRSRRASATTRPGSSRGAGSRSASSTTLDVARRARGRCSRTATGSRRTRSSGRPA